MHLNIFNFGSLNIDYIYQVDEFVRAGETISSLGVEAYPGGKGLNQSVAIRKGGGKVYHVGSVGEDGSRLLRELVKAGVDVSCTKKSAVGTGHAIIQVNHCGQNCIIIAHGANYDISVEDVEAALAQAQPGDVALMQNEVNQIPEIMRRAKVKQLKLVFNPSPITPELADYPLELVDTFILNEIEGGFLTDRNETEEILEELQHRYPEAEFILTLGEEGCVYRKQDVNYVIPARKVQAIDTTGAGDTFCGYYLASIARNFNVEDSLKRATAAASIAVTRTGASTSVPASEEVDHLLLS